MEKGVLGVICGAIGAAIGSVATYFITKNKAKEQAEIEVKAQYEAAFGKAQSELKAFYEANYVPKREPIKDSILAKAMVIEPKKGPSAEDKLRLQDDVKPENYNEFYTLPEAEKVESDGSEYEFYEDYGGVPDGKYPRIITKKEFDEPNGNVKLKLTYYEESAVFAHTGDSTNSGFTEEYFGLQNLGEFGNYKYDDGETDPYTLYFRSDSDGTDFQVYYEPYETYDEVLAKEGSLI